MHKEFTRSENKIITPQHHNNNCHQHNNRDSTQWNKKNFASIRHHQSYNLYNPYHHNGQLPSHMINYLAYTNEYAPHSYTTQAYNSQCPTYQPMHTAPHVYHQLYLPHPAHQWQYAPTQQGQLRNNTDFNNHSPLLGQPTTTESNNTAVQLGRTQHASPVQQPMESQLEEK